MLNDVETGKDIETNERDETVVAQLKEEIAKLKYELEGVISLNKSCNDKLDLFREIWDQVQARLRGALEQSQKALLRVSADPFRVDWNDIQAALDATEEVLFPTR